MTKNPKQQQGVNQKKGQNNKKSQMVQVEDFFTNFIAKKIRNLKKKLEKIAELEKKQKSGETLKVEQIESISRKQETHDLINDNIRIKNYYLEAYAKKDEYAPEKKENAVSNQEEDENEKKAAEVVKLSDEEIEQRGVTKAIHSIAKFAICNMVLQSDDLVKQFCEHSKGEFSEEHLKNMVAIHRMHFREEITGKNGWDRYQDFQQVLLNVTNETPLLTASPNTSFADIGELTEKIIASDQFNDFVPKVHIVETNSPSKTTNRLHKPSTENGDIRKESGISKTKRRKDSEAQQEIFMADSDEEEEENDKFREKEHEMREEKPGKAANEEGQKKSHDDQKGGEKFNQQGQKKHDHHQKKDNKHDAKKENRPDVKKENKPVGDDDEEEEWYSANKNTRQFDSGRGGRGDRGGRGRGGRNNDGENKDGKGRRPYTASDGERREGDGERRKGGRRNFHKDGEKKPYRPRGGRIWKKDGEQRGGNREEGINGNVNVDGLKEIGTNNKPVENVAEKKVNEDVKVIEEK